MFNIGEYIIYGSTGVCQVMDITTVDMDGVPGDKVYYILRPCYKNGSQVFSPVDNQKTPMRRILTKSEAAELVESIPAIKELWISNDKQREEKYKQAIRSCECVEWISIIKALYVRGRERVAQGKKMTATDERYLKMAQDNLYSELAIPLEIPRDMMDEYFKNAMAFL